MKIVKKLDQLTSLRFIAAFMIVFHHTHIPFGLDLNYKITLDNGVSFFFILSGFILTYVYPAFGSWIEIKRFYRARIARIYPAYLACLILGFILLPWTIEIKTFIPYILMVQAWIPLAKYYFAYNGAGWSVSTEFFFYLVFPLILATNFKKYIVVLVSSSVVLVLIFKLAGTSLISVDTFDAAAYATRNGLEYINPLVRIFEFIVGMGVALVWRTKILANINVYFGTLLEIVAIVYSIYALHNGDFHYLFVAQTFGEAAYEWLWHCGSIFALAFFVYVFSLGRGVFSKLLNFPLFVFLGEISYSVYLTHQTILSKFFPFFHVAQGSKNSFSNMLSFVLYNILVISVSYLMWDFVEKPFRNILLGKFPKINLKGSILNIMSLVKHKPTMAIFLIAFIFIFNKFLWPY